SRDSTKSKTLNTSPPEFPRGYARTFRHGGKLRPDHVGVHRGLSDPGAVAAVRAGKHVLAADQPRVAPDALRNELGMLNEVRFRFDHARDQHLAVGQLHALEQRPFVRMTRIGGL